MIREFNHEELRHLNEFIRYEQVHSEVNNNEIDSIREICSDAKKFIVWEDGGIKGFAYIIIADKEKSEGSVQIYVTPKERRKGIGTLLHKEIEKFLEIEKLGVLVTEFRVDIDDPTPFYKKVGYKKWYGSPELYYKGKLQPEVDIEFVHYEDKYYEQYAKCKQECFYEISKKNDFKPYITPLSEEDKRKVSSNKDYIYIALDNEKLVSAITVKDGYLDHIMVAPAYQGKGYGKKTTQFGINKELKRGASSICLCYIEGNDKAENLYKSLGFETVQVTHVYRKFM